MDIASNQTDNIVLLLTGLTMVLLLMGLIIVARVHALIALIIVSLITALVTGIGAADVLPVMMQGFGSTLAAVALLVGLGGMIGKLLESSGGADVLAPSCRTAPLAGSGATARRHRAAVPCRA